MTRKALPGVGNLTFGGGGGGGEIEPEKSGFNFFVRRPTHAFARMEQYKGKDLAFCERVVHKKSLRKVCSIF